MLATIKDNKYVHLSDFTPTIENLLDKWFSVRNPDRRYIIGIVPGVTYDGWVRKYDRIRRRLPIAFLRELKENCKKSGIRLMVVDHRSPPEFIANVDVVNEDLLPGIKLEDYQMRAIRAACNEECGVISAPTGSGKSELIAGIIRAYNCPTVVFAEQTVVIDQLKERLELREVASEIGLFYAGETPEGCVICIGTSASLFIPPKPKIELNDPIKHVKLLQARQTRARNANRYRDLVGKAEMIIVDECDAGISTMHKKVFRKWFNGRYKFGLSGTPFDKSKPVEGLTVRELYGNIIVKVDRKEVEACGRIVPISYNMIVIGEDGDKWEESTWDVALREKIVENGKFHETIMKIVTSFPDDGTLILVEINDLGQALQDKIPGSTFVNGQTPRGRRKKIFEEFEKRELKCLIGGKIIKRGFDLKGGCENIILCGMGKLQSDLLQQIGRAVRLNSRGKSRVFDFYCMNNKYLYDHSKERLKVMVREGFTTRVAFRNGIIAGHELIARKFRSP